MFQAVDLRRRVGGSDPALVGLCPGHQLGGERATPGRQLYLYPAPIAIHRMPLHFAAGLQPVHHARQRGLNEDALLGQLADGQRPIRVQRGEDAPGADGNAARRQLGVELAAGGRAGLGQQVEQIVVGEMAGHGPSAAGCPRALARRCEYMHLHENVPIV